MKTIQKTASNGVTAIIGGNTHIALHKDGKKIADGSHVSDGKYFGKLPVGAVSVLRGNKDYPLSAMTNDLVIAALAEYNDQPEIKLPRARAKLAEDVRDAWDRWSYNRELDFDNDTGLHHSVNDEAAAKAAEQALKDFDAAHPELAAKIAKERAEKTERGIQSALNA